MASRIDKSIASAVLALWGLAPAAWAGEADKSAPAALCVVERNDLWNARFLKCCTPSAQAGGSCQFQAFAEPDHFWDETQFITFTGGSSF